MLKIRSWERWQRPFIYEVTRRRKDKSAPVTMRYVALAAELDDEPRDGADEGNWRRFARLVGPRQAETMLVRVLQYVATKAALTGQIRVSRESFGAVVLSRDLDVVSRADGERVYDALLISGIAEAPSGPVSGHPAGDMTGQPPGQSPGQPSGPVSGQTPGEPSGDLTGDPPPLAGAPAHARSVSVDGDGSPPQPSPAGEGGGSGFGLIEEILAPLTAGERAVAEVIASALERCDVRPDPTPEILQIDELIAAAERELHAATRDRDANALAAVEGRMRRLRKGRSDLALATRLHLVAHLRGGHWSIRDILARWQSSDALVGPKDHRVPLRVACLAARKGARQDERDRRREERRNAQP